MHPRDDRNISAPAAAAAHPATGGPGARTRRRSRRARPVPADRGECDRARPRAQTLPPDFQPCGPRVQPGMGSVHRHDREPVCHNLRVPGYWPPAGTAGYPGDTASCRLQGRTRGLKAICNGMSGFTRLRQMCALTKTPKGDNAGNMRAPARSGRSSVAVSWRWGVLQKDLEASTRKLSWELAQELASRAET